MGKRHDVVHLEAAAQTVEALQQQIMESLGIDAQRGCRFSIQNEDGVLRGVNKATTTDDFRRATRLVLTPSGFCAPEKSGIGARTPVDLLLSDDERALRKARLAS